MYSRSRDGSVLIATRLRARRPRSRGSNSDRGKRLSLPYNVHTAPGAHPASNAVGKIGGFSGVKGQVREADQLPPSTADVKNIPPIPNIF
jgi:hypothetical protein